MLAPFLRSLSLDDQFHVSPRDWHRLNLVLRTSGAAADIERVRAILRSVLICSDSQRSAFDRRFDDFFPAQSTQSIDIHKALSDLDTLMSFPAPTPEEETQHDVVAIKQPPRESKPSISPSQPTPLIELVDEQPLLLDMEDEQFGQWLDDLPPAEFDPNGPTYFSMGMVCRQPVPMLSDDQLHEAADSLGYFRSDAFSNRLDVPRSIDATLRSGGAPTPRFENRRQVLSLALLVDQAARDLQWNTVPTELAEGLRRHGVSVATYAFHGVPDRFTDSRGHVVEIEDLEEIRRQLIVMLFTDGHGMFRPVNRRPLERMSRWPRVALLDPRPHQLWDLLPSIARSYRLSVYTCDGAGVIECLRRYTSESGNVTDPIIGLRDVGRQHRIVRGNYGDNEEKFLRERLGPRVLRFAQACALVPSISLGLADRLRQRFFPELAPSALGQLLALPGTRLTYGGIGFSTAVRDELLRQFQTQDKRRQDEVASFIVDQLQVQFGLPSESRGFATDSLPGLSQLQARFHIGLVRALVSKESADEEQMIRIWKTSQLSDSVDDQLGTVLDRVQSEHLRRVAQSRLRIGDSTPPVEPQRIETPKHLARIPAGKFWMGDPSQQGYHWERPRHQLYVSEFFLEKTPVTWSLWQQVRHWALENGYKFGDDAAGSGKDHPVQTVNWYDAVKWCNARSEMEGLQPCYFADAKHLRVYRAGDVDLANDCVDWDASGYRLPTEAEWENAARGGLEGQHYPWPSPADQEHSKLITKKQANFDTNGTSDVGKYAANDYGLHDMSGNVLEWCWDSWDDKWYHNPGATADNTRGPSEAGGQRVYRGGGWAFDARGLRCSFRSGGPPGLRYESLGFRVARGRLEPASRERVAEVEARDEPPTEATSERSSRRARVTFVGSSADQQGTVTLTAPHVPGRTRTIALGKADAVEPGLWRATFASPGFQTARASIEARAFYQRTYCVTLRPEVPDNLARIPAGNFWMGDPSDQGQDRERPRHQVYVSDFFLEKVPVIWANWQWVCDWAADHGYEFGQSATVTDDNRPVRRVSWFDAVKWSNARSEMEGLRPCYYTDASSRNSIYRSGYSDLGNDCVDWDADGYRLPTEVEWEKAARGGLDGHHFPWASPGRQDYRNLISSEQANYGGGSDGTGGTSPVGRYEPNGYGLYDMSGNVWEWCWDVFDVGWYDKSDANVSDTRGPRTPFGKRVYRGGGWASGVRDLRCSYRLGYPPARLDDYLGFRVARSRLDQAGRY